MLDSYIFGWVWRLTFVGVNFWVMFTHFGHIHSVILKRSSEHSSIIFKKLLITMQKHNLPEILPFPAMISLLVQSDIRKKWFSKNQIQWNIPTHQFWCIFHAAQRQTWVQCERVSACNFFSFRNVFYFSSILYTLVEPGRTQRYSRKRHSHTLHFKKWFIFSCELSMLQ